MDLVDCCSVHHSNNDSMLPEAKKPGILVELQKLVSDWTVKVIKCQKEEDRKDLAVALQADILAMITKLVAASLFEEDYYSNELDGQACSKEELASVLINVCQECEELLVEAGKKYRSALSIDGDDMRALYNWGLALSFRAQLIADIGPEAALDADKVFLAAIDKFDAMMSKSNTHAPDDI